MRREYMKILLVEEEEEEDENTSMVFLTDDI